MDPASAAEVVEEVIHGQNICFPFCYIRQFWIHYRILSPDLETEHMSKKLSFLNANINQLCVLVFIKCILYFYIQSVEGLPIVRAYFHFRFNMNSNVECIGKVQLQSAVCRISDDNC